MSVYEEASEILDSLNDEQLNLYRLIMGFAYSQKLTDDNYIDAVIAVEALAKLMRLSHNEYLRQRTLH